MAGCRVLTDEEVFKVLGSVEGKYKLLVLIGVTYGTRISESLALRVRDFSSDEVTIRALKGGDSQNYPITETVRRAVNEVIKEYESKGITVTPDTHLFCNEHGDRLSRQGATKALNKLFKKNNLAGKVAAHSLRKTFVTKIYEATGKDILATRLFSRHKSVGNLIYYVESCADKGLVRDFGW